MPRAALSASGFKPGFAGLLDSGATSCFQAQASLLGFSQPRDPRLCSFPGAFGETQQLAKARAALNLPSPGGPPRGLPAGINAKGSAARAAAAAAAPRGPQPSYPAHSCRARSGSRAPSLRSLRSAFSPGTLSRASLRGLQRLPQSGSHSTLGPRLFPAPGSRGRVLQDPVTPGGPSYAPSGPTPRPAGGPGCVPGPAQPASRPSP